MKLLKFALSSVILVISGCFTSHSAMEIQNQPEVAEDLNYRIALENATRSANIYENFETKVIIHTTFLSHSFRQEFKNRLKTLYSQSTDQLDEAIDQSGFFVSIFTPDDKESDLDRPHLWAIYLQNGNTRIFPKLIKLLPEKKRWSPFFPYVHKWSKEFLILFSLSPDSIMSDAKLLQNELTSLTFSSSEIKMTIPW